jgi:hypothetical protein
MFRSALVHDRFAPALPLGHKPVGRWPETHTASRARQVRGTSSCRGENTPRSSPPRLCKIGLAQRRLQRQGRRSSVRSGNAMPGAGGRFAAKIVKVMYRREAAFSTRTGRFQIQHNIYIESLYPSLRRFAGRPVIESSGSPLLLVPGRLDVRMSLSSWLTRLTGYLIFESSKQLSDGLP